MRWALARETGGGQDAAVELTGMDSGVSRWRVSKSFAQDEMNPGANHLEIEREAEH